MLGEFRARCNTEPNNDYKESVEMLSNLTLKSQPINHNLPKTPQLRMFSLILTVLNGILRGVP